jgi:hypothetical protein
MTFFKINFSYLFRFLKWRRNKNEKRLNGSGACTKALAWKTRMFVTASHSHPSLIFASEAEP